MSVTRRELEQIVSELLELPYRHPGTGKANQILRVITNAMTKALRQGDTIKIDGFGIFKLYTRPATRHGASFFYGGRKTGMTHGVVDVPSKTFVVFKPSKVLLTLLNKEPHDH